MWQKINKKAVYGKKIIIYQIDGREHGCDAARSWGTMQCRYIYIFSRIVPVEAERLATNLSPSFRVRPRQSCHIHSATNIDLMHKRPSSNEDGFTLLIEFVRSHGKQPPNAFNQRKALDFCPRGNRINEHSATVNTASPCLLPVRWKMYAHK